MPSLTSTGSWWITGQAQPTAEEVTGLRAAVAADLGGRYEVGEYLGRGGFATVWSALDRVSGERLAVKRFHAKSQKPRGFYSELSVLFRLHHPGVVRIVNLCEVESGSRYLMLEYCAGGTLRAAMSRGKREGRICPPSRAVEIALELSEALAAAHTQGIVHRDVKPENILFTSPPGDWTAATRVKLADFGLARALTGPPRGGALLALSGSPAYMAPEQFTGEYAEASDLYALGIVLYELLSGRAPFAGSPEELARAHLCEPPSLKHLPSEWAELLGGVLQKSPAGRPSLREWLNRLRTMARPVHHAVENRDEEAMELTRAEQEALDRELGRLEGTLSALGAMRRGQRLRYSDRQLLSQYNLATEAAHPSVNQMVVWDSAQGTGLRPGYTSGKGEPVVPMPLPTKMEMGPLDRVFAGEEDEEASGIWSGMGAGVKRSEPGRNEADAESSGAGGSVESVLGQFDWR